MPKTLTVHTPAIFRLIFSDAFVSLRIESELKNGPLQVPISCRFGSQPSKNVLIHGK